MKKNKTQSKTIYYGVIHPCVIGKDNRDHAQFHISMSEKVINHHALLKKLQGIKNVIAADYSSKLSDCESVRNCEEVHLECSSITVITNSPDIIPLEAMKETIKEYFTTLVKEKNDNTVIEEYPEYEDEGEPASLAFY